MERSCAKVYLGVGLREVAEFWVEKAGAVEEAGTPRAEYQCPECAKVFLSSRARATHESRVYGKRRPAFAYARDGNVPAVLATFIREFGWSTICRTRQ